MLTRRILLGLDGSPGADAARSWCCEHALALHAEVVAVCVVELGPVVELPQASYGAGEWITQVHEELAREIEEWVEPLRRAGVPCTTVVREGNAAEMLERVADAEGCDLIVVGRRRHGGFAELLLGSVPHALAHHADRPVVVVPLLAS